MISLASFDLETTGLHLHQGDEVFSFCLGFISPNGEKVDVVIHRLDRDPRSRALGLEVLQKFFNDTSTEKVAHNLKFDLTGVRKLGIKIPEKTIFHDTMIMSQILQNLRHSHKLKDLIKSLNGLEEDPTLLAQKVKGMAKSLGGFHKVPDHLMTPYQQGDAHYPILLALLWIPKLKASTRTWEDYRNEIDLIVETVYMEEFGIAFNPYLGLKLLKFLEEEVEKINIDCLRQFGEIPNLNSPDQMAYYLYKKFDLPVYALTDSGKPSTGKDILIRLREETKHPFLDTILKQRSYTKGVGMLHGYLKFKDSKHIIHSEILTNEAATSRQSSRNPNLQNVTKRKSIDNPFAVPLRQVFTAHENHYLHLVDYKGIEFRLIVDRSGEDELIKILNKGDDLHDHAGAIWYGDHVRPEKRWSLASKPIRKDLRNSGKAASFAKFYLGGMVRISEILGLTREETLKSYTTFCERWPKAAFFSNLAMKKAKENDYRITTAFGRILEVEKSMLHAAGNADIQGTAAGVLKRAQVRIGKYLRKNKIPMHAVIPVHDEIIFNSHRSIMKDEKEILREVSKIMVDMPEIKVPLEVDWKKSVTTWDGARELSIN